MRAAYQQVVLVFLAFTFIVTIQAITLPKTYNVVWTSQSRNSSESMPVGGGDIGLNVWSENNTILFYIAKSGTFDENNSMLKLGRVRLTLVPNPFTRDDFRQTLVLNDGYILFEGKNNSTLKIWVDVFNPVIHVEFNSHNEVSFSAGYESWRYEDRAMNLKGQHRAEQEQSSRSSGNWTIRGDDIEFYKGGVRTTHHNLKETVFDFTIAQQQMESHASTMYNPLAGNSFGLLMYSADLVPGSTTTGKYVNTTFRSWGLKPKKNQKSYNLQIAVGQSQEKSKTDFQSKLDATFQKASSSSQIETIKWWHQYWDRSYIIINEKASARDGAFQVGKNYQLFRFMQGCNAFSEWPLRFNGGLWTFDPVFVNPDAAFTPDYRRWTGGTFTAQNQRLVYWPLLKSGDIDLMKPQFDFYRRITGNARLRGLLHFGLNATVFTEQIDNYGLPSPKEYDGWTLDDGVSRPATFPVGMEYNTWLSFVQDTANEFADMILQANLFNGLDVTPYMEFIERQLMWFDLFYQQEHKRFDVFGRAGQDFKSDDGNGPLVIFPGSGAETYKAAYNPSSTISGLRKVLQDLLQVAPKYVVNNRTYYEGYLQRVPETPLRHQQGKPCISPAQGYARIQNTEIPQLYPVFPWGEYGLGQPNLTFATNTYFYDSETQDFHKNNGWNQDVIWMARMGLTAQAKNMTLDRWSDSKIYRFPAFKGPNYDWSPDINHYGSASIALQEMIMQTYVANNTQIRLGGAWPADWDVKFKLHAPFNTTVTGRITNGSHKDLKVVPESRLKNVVYGSQ